MPMVVELERDEHPESQVRCISATVIPKFDGEIPRPTQASELGMTTKPMGSGEDGLRWKRTVEGETPRSLTLPRNDGG